MIHTEYEWQGSSSWVTKQKDKKDRKKKDGKAKGTKERKQKDREVKRHILFH